MTPEEHQAIWVQTYRLFCEDLRELTKELRTFTRVDKSSFANSPAVTTASDVGVRESARACGCDPGAGWVCDRHQ